MTIESVLRIEPALLEQPSAAIADVLAELSAASATLGRALHPRTAANLAGLVRIMNTYYSNLIEGHDTHPRDIERALAGELAPDEGRRNLQIEAAAHAKGALSPPASVALLQWLHREFYQGAGEAMLTISADGRQFRMEQPSRT